MVKEAYCSFEVAKLLKEKGFNWRTQYVYTLDGTGSTPHKIGNWRAKSDIQKPTHQMAMAWLREEKNCIISIWYTGGGFYAADYYIKDDNEEIHDIIGTYKTYDEAVEKSLKDALTILI